ncbi:hypothetical protein SKAU_G00289330 [Synaphobranchus kaupii]|uniref:PiggyBac transposable element-derived protein domain-containing protein n=1 Tax=Synaphobranchus kaupii TaxID=118154 RepID=A0A9Q1IK07_SYNKA|nr:hypothetical protein SKAU_G00289330 [Synaphobranchus kaupii]
MIPFKGKFSGIRQYMKGKPHPWGFKVWARTGISGILCDFDVYQGSVQEEKELKKQGRGSFDFRVEQTHNICAVRWYDNRAVTLLSTFDGPQPVDKITRWDKSAKHYVEVSRPSIVKTYNRFMGGIDLLDSFTAKYKFHIRSMRWYLTILWHTIILGVVNAWLQYKRDCKTLQIPEKEVMNRRHFQAQLATSLIQTNTMKRGRPSMDESRAPRAAMARSAPPPDVRRDNVGHLPMKVEKRGRCVHCKDGYTTTACIECDVRLCFNDHNNCFHQFHT